MKSATRVASAVQNWFDSSPCQKKYSQDDWTVLSGVVLQYPLFESEQYGFRVLACATGSKCVGRDRSDSNGFVVNDCHAEVLARRSFMRFLYHEAMFWISVSKRGISSELVNNSIFRRNDSNGKLVLKKDYTIHLYISESPCGEASVYPLKSEVVDKYVADRMQRNINSKDMEQTRTKLRKTGAKLCEVNTLGLKSDSNTHKTQFRTKSGRSDIPLYRQTTSISCSNKIAKWMILGLQGTLLTHWFDHLYLSSIVIGQDQLCESIQLQEDALTQFLRQQHLNNSMKKPISCTVVPSAKYTFTAHKRTFGARIASIAVNWTECESHWQNVLTTMLNIDPFIKKRFLCDTRKEEVLLAACGILEGGRYPKTTDVDEKRLRLRRTASRLSKASFFAVWQYLMQTNKVDSCIEAKKRIWNASEHLSKAQQKYVQMYRSRNGRNLNLDQEGSIDTNA